MLNMASKNGSNKIDKINKKRKNKNKMKIMKFYMLLNRVIMCNKYHPN